MASYEHPKLVATMQYLKATEKPLAAIRTIDRSGTSGFLEVRRGPTGWAGLLRVEAYDPDRQVSVNSDHRIIAGGAYWFNTPRSRFGIIVTNERVTYGTAARRPNARCTTAVRAWLVRCRTRARATRGGCDR